jgi:hypothetical protein
MMKSKTGLPTQTRFPIATTYPSGKEAYDNSFFQLQEIGLKSLGGLLDSPLQ